MVDSAALQDALLSIARQTQDDMSERDVENLFLEQGFYDALDYEGTGTDIRSEFTLPDDRRPDYITLDSNEAVTAVFEFKTTGRELSPHEDQLFHYMEYLRAEFGVLTNGEQLRLYRRTATDPILAVSLAEITESGARDITSALRKREFDLTNPDHVNEFLESLDPVPLDEQAELGQEHFFDTFRLEENSPFADLVTGMMDLLHELRDEREAKFVKGAYDFWEATYADEPEEIPDSWEPFIDGDQSLKDFMFCLESGHALLARLLLAKATEDHDFFAGTGYGGMADYFRGLQGFSQTINLDAFPVAADNLIDDMQDQLVEGLFQDDIFVWWTDGYAEELSRSHETGPNQFAAVAEEADGIDRISEPTRDRFSRSVAEIFFNVLRFDFADVQGDLLGDLYQRYFDPETRKALGEFYTPQPVIDYIMDGVGYDRGAANSRLIDPACGSGTFLVEAVDRYIEDVERYADGDPDWQTHLQDLCTRPRIVGLDIHPFAVLMAQIRFVVAILPAYRKAKSQDSEFTLRRLPIYRTDTLRNERQLTGTDLGEDGSRQMTWDALTEDEQDVRIPVPLPVEVDEDEAEETEEGFLVRRVRMPLFDTIQLETGVSNFGEYFAALQGVLDTVKDHMALAEEFGDDFDWTYQSGLEERVNHYTARDYSGVEEFFAPYVDDMLENVRYLKEEHNDGRLFKMFEDTVLALVVKNYMEYDYVVGNPPYVRVQHLPDRQKEMLDRLYDSTTGNYDIYCVFFERALELLREDTGKLGFITSNQFLLSDYGEGVRRVLLEKSTIEEVSDFRDSGVFEDAANLPVILFSKHESNREARQENNIRCSRVKSNITETSQNKLDNQVVESIRQHRNESRYRDEYIDIFDFPQRKLDDQFWPLMPPEELNVFEKLNDKRSSTLDKVTKSISSGTQTSANKVYIVVPQNADRIDPHDKGDSVTVVPLGENKEYEIEADLLRPWLQGIDVQRWRGDWAGQHVIFPYYIEENENNEADPQLYCKKEMETKFPKTWDYFKQHEGKLRGRESGRWENSDVWWEFGRPQNLEKFRLPKIINADMASNARFMIDEDGLWHFKTPYGIYLEPDLQPHTDRVACLVNSKVFDFYLKHIAPMLLGGKYRYQSRYLGELPYIDVQNGTIPKRLDKAVGPILNALDTENKMDRFPEAYIGDYDGELDYITYEWNTRRYPVSAEVQQDDDGDFTVQAGRSDTIKDSAMYSDNLKVQKNRAEYVLAAVDGRNVQSGEEMTIPIPRTDDGVEALLDRLETDRLEVQQTNIQELEAQIDEAVYDLFDLKKDEREVIEDYLEVF